MNLEIVTCFYNPCSYQRILSNYWKFRDELNHPLTTVELSFNGKFEIDDAIHVEGNSSNLMWQKERLLNIAIERSNADAVAFVDADLIWLNPNWIDETKEKLEKFPVVQLFQNVVDLDADGNVARTLPGHVYGTFIDASGHLRPGGAWAATKRALRHKLDDSQIMGGGDCLWLASISGNWQHSILKFMSQKWRQSSLKHGAKVYPLVRNRLGYVSGDVQHLFHGTQENRNYVGRWRKLTDHDFNPDEDIEIDDNGLFKWSSDKPEMHREVANYFWERKEDE